MEHRYIEIREWEAVSPESRLALSGLDLQGSAGRAVADKLSREGKLKFQELRSGLSIESTAFVGRVCIGNLTVTVIPKLGERLLLGLLRYAYGLRDLYVIGKAKHYTRSDAFQDILVFQLIAEATELISRGLHRRYVRKESNLSCPVGRVDMRRMSDPRWCVSGRLPCSFFPRSENNLHNQVLAAGLLLGAKVAHSVALRKDCRRLAGILNEAISPISLSIDAIRRVWLENSRMTAAYRPAIRIIEILYQSSGATITKGSATPVLSGFLFDMNLFFQALLSRFLSDNLRDFRVYDERRLKGMLSYVPGYNPRNRRSPQPRPDFVIEQNNRPVAVLDAKYRDLWENALPRDMLYQLAIYALSQEGGGQATILYPTTRQHAREAKIRISDSLSDANKGEVVLRPIVLPTLYNLVSGPNSLEIQRQRQRYAENMVFGRTEALQ